VGQRQRIWAARARDALRFALGQRCAWCDRRTSTLEFDVIDSSDETHHRFEWSARISFYRKMNARGNLQLLCKRCHGRKSSAAATAAAYEPIPPDQLWWCNTHRRRADHFFRGRPYCTGPGIMLPCFCVNLTGIAELEETAETPLTKTVESGIKES